MEFWKNVLANSLGEIIGSISMIVLAYLFKENIKNFTRSIFRGNIKVIFHNNTNVIEIGSNENNDYDLGLDQLYIYNDAHAIKEIKNLYFFVPLNIESRELAFDPTGPREKILLNNEEFGKIKVEMIKILLPGKTQIKNLISNEDEIPRVVRVPRYDGKRNQYRIYYYLQTEEGNFPNINEESIESFENSGGVLDIKLIKSR